MIKAKRGDSESRKVGKIMTVRAGTLPRSGFVHLARTASSSISISIAYIVLLTKLQKKANPRKWICPYLKNDTPNIFDI